MGKRAECKLGDHTFGEPTGVGGGILRLACERCGAVQLDMSDFDDDATSGGLFASAQGHSLFSPIVEYAAVHGEELVEERRFGEARDSYHEQAKSLN